MAKVIIADDHAIVRAGLRALIHADASLELVGEAAGGYEAIELVEKNRPEILVLDLSMPDLDGISVTREIHLKFPDLNILILTLHEDEALLKEAIKAGASGYILKRAAETELISAIRTILRGDLYVDPSMVRALLNDPLHISVRTVEGHRANILEKLGLHSRVEMVRYAREHGLIE